MAIYALPDYIKRRRNDHITPEDQHSKDLRNLPSGFLLPTAALSNISKNLSLSHLICSSAAQIRVLQETGSRWMHMCFRWAILLPIALRTAFLHTWISISIYLCTPFSCPQIILTWCHLPVLNTSAPGSTSVCSYTLFTSICRKGYRPY